MRSCAWSALGSAVLGGLLLSSVAGCLAQASAAGPASPSTPKSAVESAPASFTVAAIHQDLSDQHARSHIFNDPANGSFKAINVPLLALLQVAYDLPASQILGGPKWLRTTRFDVEAKSDPETDAELSKLSGAESRRRKAAMLQGLLAERFGLASHREAREMPVYLLTVAKPALLPPAAKGGTTIDEGHGRLSALGVSSAVLAAELAKAAGRVVLDRTELPGRYDVVLRWQPEDVPVDGDGSLPSLFTAVTEQLGLRLDAGRGAVPVLVVDGAQEPSAN